MTIPGNLVFGRRRIFNALSAATGVLPAVLCDPTAGLSAILATLLGDDTLAGLTVITKTSDETVNNSNTFQDDDELKLPLLANEVHSFTLTLLIDAAANADIKFQFVAPSGAVVYWFITEDASNIQDGSFDVLSGAGVGTVQGAIYHGTVINGSNAGDMQVQWAQNVAQSSDAKVLAGSTIVAFKS